MKKLKMKATFNNGVNINSCLTDYIAIMHFLMNGVKKSCHLQ